MRPLIRLLLVAAAAAVLYRLLRPFNRSSSSSSSSSSSNTGEFSFVVDGDGQKAPPFDSLRPKFDPTQKKSSGGGTDSGDTHHPSDEGHVRYDDDVEVDEAMERTVRQSSFLAAMHADPEHIDTRPTGGRRCLPHLGQDAHWIDHRFIASLALDEIVQHRARWRHHRDTVAMNNINMNAAYVGRGIVYTAYDDTFDRVLTSIRFLKHWKCSLPIEVWYVGNELSLKQQERLRALHVTPRDVLIEQAAFPQFNSFKVDPFGGERNYHVKGLVLLLTRFQEVLYLDSDNYPLRNPEFLFDTDEYKKHGALFWPDFWKMPIDHPMFRLAALPCEDEHEFESGQMVLDKKRVLPGLLMAMYFQQEHDFYFKILLGDKDTFRFGFRLVNLTYHLVKHRPAIAGRIRLNRFCGHTMVQREPGSGELLFVHTTAMKTTMGIRKGNTWESVQVLLPSPAHQLSNTLLVDNGNGTYLKETLPSHLVRVLGGYPRTVEYQNDAAEPGFQGRQNPCLEYRIDPITLRLNQSEVAQYGGVEKSMDSYQLVTEPLGTYHGGKFSEFENLYYAFGGIGTRILGTCGGGFVGDGKCPNPKDCCSKFGYCDTTPDHCGIGCLGGPCFYSRRLPDRVPPDYAYCGNGHIGTDGLCEDIKACCSRFGYCSNSVDHCSKLNCLSGPCLT